MTTPETVAALLDIARRIDQEAIPTTASGQTCFVPLYQIEQLRDARKAIESALAAQGQAVDIPPFGPMLKAIAMHCDLSECGSFDGQSMLDAVADAIAWCESPAQPATPVESLCEDCPPKNYPTDVTRCTPCPRRLGPVESLERGAGIDSPHFNAVAWFDTFNAHVYFNRDAAQRAHDGGNTVLPIESMAGSPPASVPDEIPFLRVVAKRNLTKLIEIGSDDKALMLKCLEELS